jgi:hypothetical protein
LSRHFTTVDTSLNRAEFRWKWLKTLHRTFILGVILSCAVLLLGAAMVLGWVGSKAFVLGCFIGLAVLGFIAWAVILISVAASAPERGFLAAALERVDRRLKDRLNTVTFLERRRSDPAGESFAVRIAHQAHGLLTDKVSPPPFKATQPLVWLLGFILCLTATVLVYELYSPWSRLLEAEKMRRALPPTSDKPLELALPPTNNVEQERLWGEVRITDPGADLKVTKVDVVPMQIEAAANQPLKSVDWFSAVNGAQDTPHELPPPKEPRYAAYQPVLYLDEYKLSDWDVMTYYAHAQTEQPNSFASEVYFLEVRPFREDILKMPGGEGGKAYECLSELTALIHRQQHVIRQTHQHVQSPPPQENLETQDRKKLSDAESDLRDSAQHLYARMTATMENTPIGEALDNLAKAEDSLDGARKKLAGKVMDEAQGHEREALTDLIAARKMFHKAVTDHPSDFANSSSDTDSESSPVVDTSKKLDKITEFRNESKATLDFLQKSLEEQERLEQKARTGSRSNFPQLGTSERTLEQSLENFQNEHPQQFKNTQEEAKSAQQAMTNAATSLEQRSNSARLDMRQATEQLTKLNQAVASQAAGQQLANAYRLKQMLDQQIKTLDEHAQAQSQLPQTNLQQTASEARQTVNELKKVAEQEPTSDAFGQPLRDALSGQNKVDLDAKLTQLQQAADAASQRQHAAESSEALTKVSKAFSASEPAAMRAAERNDSLKPDPQDSLSDGIAELESLVHRLESEHQLSREDMEKQGQQALYNLQMALRGERGNNDQGNQLLIHLQDALKKEAAPDVPNLKKLLDELHQFSVETSEKPGEKPGAPKITNIDPSRLPPEYRGRIQKYFQKLSER